MHRVMIELGIIERGPDEAFMFSVHPDVDDGDRRWWCHYVSDFGNVIGKARFSDDALADAKKRAVRLEKLLEQRYGPEQVHA